MANMGKGTIASTKYMVCSNRVIQLMSPGKLLLHGHTWLKMSYPSMPMRPAILPSVMEVSTSSEVDADWNVCNRVHQRDFYKLEAHYVGVFLQWVDVQHQSVRGYVCDMTISFYWSVTQVASRKIPSVSAHPIYTGLQISTTAYSPFIKPQHAIVQTYQKKYPILNLGISTCPWVGLPRSTAVTLFAKFSWITMGGYRWRLASLTNIVLASDSPMWPSWNCSESKNQTIKSVRLLAGACYMMTLCGSLGIRPTQEAKLSLSNCVKPRKNTSAVSQYCPGSYIWPSIGHLVEHSSFWAISSNQRRSRVPSSSGYGQSFICASLAGRWGRNAIFVVSWREERPVV